jgi:hypothetical protein
VLYLLAVQIDETRPAPVGDARRAVYDRVEAVNDAMRSQGTWVFGGGLAPSDRSTVFRTHAGSTTMTDGPFAETKEQLGGFWIIDVPDHDTALAWAARCAEVSAGAIEVRPFTAEGE